MKQSTPSRGASRKYFYFSIGLVSVVVLMGLAWGGRAVDSKTSAAEAKEEKQRELEKTLFVDRLVSPPAAPVAAPAATPATQIPRAGYQVDVSGTATVTTTFVLPTISNCPATFAGVAPGAAIFASSGHSAAGVQLLCNFGTPGYQTFIQLNGVGTGFPDLPAAGDMIKVTISVSPAGTQATVTDLTASTHWSETRSSSGGNATAAAVGIIGNCSPVPQFSTTSFTASTINSASLAGATPRDLVSGNGMLEAYPSALSAGGTAFTATWVATGGGCAASVPPTVLIGPPGSNGGVTSSPPSCAAGDPVNCVTGNLAESAPDISVPGRARALAWVRTYNSLLAASSGRLGNGWTDSYAESVALDNLGNATVQLGTGASLPFGPDGSGGYIPAATITAALSGNATTGWTLAYKDLRTDRFRPDGRLISQSDRTGETTTLSYDNQGKLTTVTDPAGRALRLSYDGSGRVTSVTDPESRVVRYHFDGAGNLASVRDLRGDTIQYAYNAVHDLVTVTDPLGRETRNQYDGADRVVAQTDPAGAVTSFVYAEIGGDGATTITDPTGMVVVESFAGYLLSTVTRGSGSPLQATWSFGYDSNADPTSSKDPNGNTWSATYDAAANRLSATDPLARTTTWTYSPTNDPLSMTDPNGATTTYAYDAHQLLVSVSTPIDGSHTSTSTLTRGDSAHPGDVTALTTPNNHTLRYGHDHAGNLVSVRNANDETTSFAFDGVGRLRSMTDPLAHTTRYETDAFGKVIELTDALGHTATRSFDGDGELTQSRDAEGVTVRVEYDPDGRPVMIIDGAGARTLVTYNPAGDRTSVIDGAGHRTSYAYDLLHRLVQISDGLSATTSFSYDAADRRTGLIDPLARTTTWGYDAANQLTGITYSDGTTSNVTFNYDPDGRRTAMSDGSGITTYTHDLAGRLTSTQDGAGRTIGFTLDAAGLLTSLSYGGVGSVAYTYDGVGRLTGLTDWLGHHFSFSADADGLFKSATAPNGVTTAMERNADEAVTQIKLARASATLATFGYTRDDDQRVEAARETATVSPALSEWQASYGRDGRLAAARGQQFRYDGAGDLTRLGNALQSFNHAAELVEQRTPATLTKFAYDQLGNRTGADVSKIRGSRDDRDDDDSGDDRDDRGDDHSSSSMTPISRTTYAYDQASRLTAVNASTNGGPLQPIASYRYNGDGLRTTATMTAGSLQFTWNVAPSTPLLLGDGANWYVYGPGGAAVEQIPVHGGSVSYLHQDQRGSVALVTGPAGQVLSAPTYTAYGKAKGATMTPFGFAGGYTDPTGLVYFLHRYYDPATGVFITPDFPWPTSGGYGYVGGNPLNAVDLQGRAATPPPYTTTFVPPGQPTPGYTTSYIPPGQSPPPYTSSYIPPGQTTQPYTTVYTPPGQTPPPYGTTFTPPPSPVACITAIFGSGGFGVPGSSTNPGGGGSMSSQGVFGSEGGCGSTLPILFPPPPPPGSEGGSTLPVLTFEGGGSTSPVLTFEGGGSTLPILAGVQGGSTLPV